MASDWRTGGEKGEEKQCSEIKGEDVYADESIQQDYFIIVLTCEYQMFSREAPRVSVGVIRHISHPSCKRSCIIVERHVTIPSPRLALFPATGINDFFPYFTTAK